MLGEIVHLPRGTAVEPAPVDVAPDPMQPQARTLFDQDWWLDAAAPGAWNRVEVCWDGVLVGDMAFHLRRRRLFNYITMPHLTRTQSPRLMPPQDKPASRRIHNLAIVKELMDKLPPHDRFERSLDVGCPSVQGFIHAGFAVTHRITLRTSPGVTPERMIRRAHRKTRQAVARAERDCIIERNGDIDRFVLLHRRVYGSRSSVHYDVLARIFAAAHARDCAEIIFVRINEEDIAALILVWDASTAYSWVFARDEQRNHPGSFNLLMYEAARSAWRLGRILDVDSYVHPSVGEFLTKFGLDVEVRPFVNGSNAMWRCYHTMRSVLRPNQYDRTFRVS